MIKSGNIQAVITDIDGVLTDGKLLLNEGGETKKSLCFKDLDAVSELRANGIKFGVISGESDRFTEMVNLKMKPDFYFVGRKDKRQVLEKISEKEGIPLSAICYIGDGKYDIPALERVGLAVCPNDAVEEVKQVSDIILKRKGGEGCLAEVYTLLFNAHGQETFNREKGYAAAPVFVKRVEEHRDVINGILEDITYNSCVEKAVNLIIDSYKNKGGLFLCGNGGSAADAQHLAAEMVGRFYLERKALSAEALTVNTSVLTSLANDYDYGMIFARQLEARAVRGDVLIGITTSGTSENVLQAFQKAKDIQMKTILMTGRISEFEPVLKYTDCLLAAPSNNTPRIQEIHILTGHIICEIVEQELANI